MYRKFGKLRMRVAENFEKCVSLLQTVQKIETVKQLLYIRIMRWITKNENRVAGVEN